MSNKISAVVLFILLFLLFNPPLSHAWLIYHKPAFHGKIIDTETKEPIEEATIRIIYFKEVFGFADSASMYLDEKEVLTDKHGEFYVPPYRTIILNPLAWFGGDSTFEVYKSGYAGYSGSTGRWTEYQVLELRKIKPGERIIERPPLPLKYYRRSKEE